MPGKSKDDFRESLELALLQMGDDAPVPIHVHRNDLTDHEASSAFDSNHVEALLELFQVNQDLMSLDINYSVELFLGACYDDPSIGLFFSSWPEEEAGFYLELTSEALQVGEGDEYSPHDVIDGLDLIGLGLSVDARQDIEWASDWEDAIGIALTHLEHAGYDLESPLCKVFTDYLW